jgi:RNA 3'-terminal phosphate cyclase (ATP)
MTLQIDGSKYSGSGTIVRQAVVLSALTGEKLRITNVRASRKPPGLRAQHTRVVESIRSLVGGRAEGNEVTSRELEFEPGLPLAGSTYSWDIGSAGSTVLLGLAIIQSGLTGPTPRSAPFRWRLLDFAPTVYHLQHVMAPLLEKLGLRVRPELVRPGYVPAGQGIIEICIDPVTDVLHPVSLPAAGPVRRVWGLSIASHLEEQQVAPRMAESAREEFLRAGFDAEFETVSDVSSVQPGAALAAFADLGGGVRLGADRAGAPGRRAEAIGRFVAGHLLEDIGSGASVDRHAADQIILFAALADGGTAGALRVTIRSERLPTREIPGVRVEMASKCTGVPLRRMKSRLHSVAKRAVVGEAWAGTAERQEVRDVEASAKAEVRRCSRTGTLRDPTRAALPQKPRRHRPVARNREVGDDQHPLWRREANSQVHAGHDPAGGVRWRPS